MLCAEQGSSASQMTHCKATWLCRTSFTRSIRLHPSTNGGHSKIAQKFSSQSVQINGYVFRDANGPNLGETFKTQWFMSNGICTETHLLASCGKDSLRELYSDSDRKRYLARNVCLFSENNDCSYRFSWMKSKGLERSRKCFPCPRH